jgi:hypothetical protein
MTTADCYVFPERKTADLGTKREQYSVWLLRKEKVTGHIARSLSHGGGIARPAVVGSASQRIVCPAAGAMACRLLVSQNPMIKANCRDRFTADDFEFIVRALARSERDSVTLVDLLTDAEARDAILDDPRLFQRVLEHHAPVSISPQLYFYLLVRHVLKETGLNDRVLSDYVAAMLECFSDTARMRTPGQPESEGPIQYVSDMLVALRNATPEMSFRIRAHMGNYALFISGIFRERVQSRSQRGAPDISFYEDVGRTSFRAVAQHQFARSWELTSVFEALADDFRGVRVALNRLSDSLLHLDSAHVPLM